MSEQSSLPEAIKKHYNLGQFRRLCLDLGLTQAELNSAGAKPSIQVYLAALHKKKKLGALYRRLQARHPIETWPRIKNSDFVSPLSPKAATSVALSPQKKETKKPIVLNKNRPPAVSPRKGMQNRLSNLIDGRGNIMFAPDAIDISDVEGDVAIDVNLTINEGEIPSEAQLYLGRTFQFWTLSFLITLVAISIGTLFQTLATSTPAPEPITRMVGEYNIAIAQLTDQTQVNTDPETDLSREMSQWLSDTLDLEENLPESLDWETRGPEQVGVVRGNNKNERYLHAAKLAETYNADVLIFGRITDDDPSDTESSPQITLEFFVTNDRFNFADEVAGPEQLGDPVPYDLINRDKQDDQLRVRVNALQTIIGGLGEFKSGRYTEAHNTFEKATMLPNWADDDNAGQAGKAVAFKLLGAAKMELGELDGAIAAYEKAIEIDYDYPLGHLEFGRIALAQAQETDIMNNKLEEAKSRLSKSLSLSEESMFILAKTNLGLGQTHLVGVINEINGWSMFRSKNHFEQVISIYKNNDEPFFLARYAAQAHAGLGMLAGLEDDWEGMAEEVQLAHEILNNEKWEPNTTKNWKSLWKSHMGYALEEQDNDYEAWVAYNEAVKEQKVDDDDDDAGVAIREDAALKSDQADSLQDIMTDETCAERQHQFNHVKIAHLKTVGTGKSIIDETDISVWQKAGFCLDPDSKFPTPTPTPTPTPSPAPKLTPTPILDNPTSAPITAENTASPRAECEVKPATGFRYLVQRGDSLGSLALRSGTTTNNLKAKNCLTSDRLIVGTTIYLPIRLNPVPVQQPSNTPTHTVIPTSSPTLTNTPEMVLPPTKASTPYPGPEIETPTATEQDNTTETDVFEPEPTIASTPTPTVTPTETTAAPTVVPTSTSTSTIPTDTPTPITPAPTDTPTPIIPDVTDTPTAVPAPPTVAPTDVPPTPIPQEDSD